MNHPVSASSLSTTLINQVSHNPIVIQGKKSIEAVIDFITSIQFYIADSARYLYEDATNLFGVYDRITALWLRHSSSNTATGLQTQIVVDQLSRDTRDLERTFKKHVQTLERSVRTAGDRSFANSLAQIDSKKSVFEQAAKFSELLHNTDNLFSFLAHSNDQCLKFALARCDIKLSRKDDNNNSLLHLLFLRTKKKINPVILNRLLAYGIQTNARNSEGLTALHLCACLGDKSSAKSLVRSGANPIAKNNKGETPCAYAMKESAPSKALKYLQRRCTLLATRKSGVSASSLDAHHSPMPLRLKGTRALQHAGSTSNALLKGVSKIGNYSKAMPGKFLSLGQIVGEFLRTPAAIFSMASVPLTLAALVGSKTNANRKRSSHDTEAASIAQEIEALQKKIDASPRLEETRPLLDKMEYLNMRLWYIESHFSGQAISHQAEIVRESVYLFGRGGALALETFQPTHPVTQRVLELFTPWMTGFTNVMTLTQTWGQQRSLTANISQLEEIQQDLEANKASLLDLRDSLPENGFHRIILSLNLRHIEQRLRNVTSGRSRAVTMKRLYHCSTVGQVASLAILSLAATTNLPHTAVTAQTVALTSACLPSLVSVGGAVSGVVNGLLNKASGLCFSSSNVELTLLLAKEKELKGVRQKQGLETGVQGELAQVSASIQLLKQTEQIAQKLGMTRQDLTLELNRLETALDTPDTSQENNALMRKILTAKGINTSTYSTDRRGLILKMLADLG